MTNPRLPTGVRLPAGCFGPNDSLRERKVLYADQIRDAAGGTAKNLASISNVRIAATTGETLADGQLLSTFQVPQDVSAGVKFEILRDA